MTDYELTIKLIKKTKNLVKTSLAVVDDEDREGLRFLSGLEKFEKSLKMNEETLGKIGFHSSIMDDVVSFAEEATNYVGKKLLIANICVN